MEIMSGRVAFVFAFAFLLTVFSQRTAAHKAYVVGNSAGWNVPKDDHKFYAKWAAGIKFVVGDSLTFDFEPDKHDVVEVSKESFKNCIVDDVRGNVITGAPAKLKINSAGEHYYICTQGKGKHCKKGQKLAITVASSAETSRATAIHTGLLIVVFFLVKFLHFV